MFSCFPFYSSVILCSFVPAIRRPLGWLATFPHSHYVYYHVICTKETQLQSFLSLSIPPRSTEERGGKSSNNSGLFWGGERLRALDFLSIIAGKELSWNSNVNLYERESFSFPLGALWWMWRSKGGKGKRTSFTCFLSEKYENFCHELARMGMRVFSFPLGALLVDVEVKGKERRRILLTCSLQYKYKSSPVHSRKALHTHSCSQPNFLSLSLP